MSAPPEFGIPDSGGHLPGARVMTRQNGKGALLDSGTPSPNPWDLSLSRQNGCFTLKALARRVGLRRDATRAPMQGPEWQGAASPAAPNSNPKPRRALAYCRHKMVLTMGSALTVRVLPGGMTLVSCKMSLKRVLDSHTR